MSLLPFRNVRCVVMPRHNFHPRGQPRLGAGGARSAESFVATTVHVFAGKVYWVVNVSNTLPSISLIVSSLCVISFMTINIIRINITITTD